MNLQENIHRIHEIMGVINEDNRPNKIMKMIDDHGLMTVIRMFGGYEHLLNYVGGEDISDGYKIKFIRDVIDSKPIDMGGVGRLSPFDFDEKPIPYGDKGNLITAIYKEGVRFPNGNSVPYSDISTDDLDKVFRFAVSNYERF